MDFGDLIGNSDAAGLVDMVRQSRLARHASSAPADEPMTEETPTFGEIAEDRRAQGAMQEEQAAQQQQAQDPKQIMAQISMLVDVTNGEFTPILPGEPTPQPGPKEIVLSFASGEPEVTAMGKRVRDVDIAKLQDPKRGIQPKLAPDYQVPPQYAGLAKALGIDMGEGEGPGAEALTGSPAPETEEPLR